MLASLFNLDVDECAAFPNICDVNADCHNTNGSYICNCKTGYSGDGKTCSRTVIDIYKNTTTGNKLLIQTVLQHALLQKDKDKSNIINAKEL
ncbi:epidermal growth factor-like protein 6 [Acropora millepora]|uniref:epidermal growth factor-like protein 6 n=1 Tax=Acropora millepora TaxID=45264 RepID=UPI001CF3561D|nr:epidermal growth factor-like protein 6 [Acropora millepora]